MSDSPYCGEGADQLDMGRPAELADRLDPVETIAALDQRLRVAGEGGRVAGDVGDPRHGRAGEQGRLLLRAGAGRIEHHRLEAVQLGDVERAAEEVAMVDEDGRCARRRLQRQRGVARAFGGEHPAVERQREGAEAGEQIGDERRASPTASRTAATRAASPSAVACRKAPCGSGTGTPPRVTVTGSGSQTRLGAVAVVEREPGEAVRRGEGGQRLGRLEPLGRDASRAAGRRPGRPGSVDPRSPRLRSSSAAQRRDQSEQLGPQDMAFAHVDDAVAGLRR